MSEQKFEELLIGQLSSGIIGEITQSVGENKDANYNGIKVLKEKLWKYEPHIKTTEDL